MSYWIVIGTELGGARTDIIPCNSEADALRIEAELKQSLCYENVYTYEELLYD